MKVLVPIKRVIDANIKVRVKADNSGVELNNVKMAMNPFCEIAVEEAIRMREAGTADEVIVVAVGPSQSQETLRTGLAMGADRAILVETDPIPEPLAIAKLLKTVAEKEDPGMIILGKQATDGDNNQVGQLLAEYMNWPQATFAYKFELNDDETGADVMREVDGGVETVRLSFPAVVTTDLRLNEPRYASLQGIMKAKRKPLDVYDPDELGVELNPKIEVVGWEMPQERQAGVLVDSIDALFDKLKNEAKVI